MGHLLGRGVEWTLVCGRRYHTIDVYCLWKAGIKGCISIIPGSVAPSLLQWSEQVRSFSNKTKYALMAAVHLARNYSPDRNFKAGEIARRTGAPEKYLRQILRQMKEKALIRSVRGPTGGYRLMRRPDMISIAEVMEAVATGDDGRSDAPERDSDYGTALHWLHEERKRVEREFLSSISLRDFARRIDDEAG
ncbi:MAG: RrF2 family transcriptional regulator [Planctomycetota bacterium]